MTAGGQKCPPGCACGRHSLGGRRACPPGCTCGRHPAQPKMDRAAKDRRNAQARQRRAADPEVARERGRAAVARWRAKHGDEIAARAAEPGRRAKVAATSRRSHAAHRDERLRRARAAYDSSEQRAKKLLQRHGMRPEDWAAQWAAQGGKCYLCNEALDPERCHIDHDHDCCRPNRSCAACRRGIACGPCNMAIGLQGDDPERMQLVVDNFRPARKLARERIAALPKQLTLDW
jgi:Recombination endonuclease VII